jgi:hypothetical protein
MVLRIFIFLVWLINGLFCKVLNIVPRHQQIVARVVGHEWAPWLTKTIGILEIGMAFGVLSQWKKRSCAIVQILTVATMNIIEVNLAPNLLLFGPYNIILAIVFIFAVYLHGFRMDQMKVPD